LAAEVHLAGVAPAFTLSFHDSESSRKPPMPIASVVSGNFRKKKKQLTQQRMSSFEEVIKISYG